MSTAHRGRDRQHTLFLPSWIRSRSFYGFSASAFVALGAIAGCQDDAAAPVDESTPSFATVGGSVGTWSAAQNFSSENPDGVWLSGWKPTLGGHLTPFNTLVLLSGTLAAWTDPSVTVIGTPNYAKNIGTLVHGGIQPGEVFLHPGCGANEVAVLRWTAPAAGNYQVTGGFGAGDIGDMSSAVLLNGDGANPLFSATSTNSNPQFSRAMTLAATEYLDFAVTNGTAGCSFGSTVLSVTITGTQLQPPLPAKQPINGPKSYSGPKTIDLCSGTQPPAGYVAVDFKELGCAGNSLQNPLLNNQWSWYRYTGDPVGKRLWVCRHQAVPIGWVLVPHDPEETFSSRSWQCRLPVGRGDIEPLNGVMEIVRQF